MSSDVSTLINLYTHCKTTYSKVAAMSYEVTKAIQAQSKLETDYQALKRDFTDSYTQMRILRNKMIELPSNEDEDLKKIDDFISHIDNVCEPSKLQQAKLSNALDTIDGFDHHDDFTHYNGIRTTDRDEKDNDEANYSTEDDDDDDDETNSPGENQKQKKKLEIEQFPNGIRYSRYGKQSKYRLDPDPMDTKTFEYISILLDRQTSIK